MRVLHCPTDTAGHAWGLSRAERVLGIKSEVMIRQSSSFGYPADINLHMEGKSLCEKFIRTILFFIKSAYRYDVFHFNFGTSLLDYWPLDFNYLDFKILKALRRKIVITFQGCDARIKSFCRGHYKYSPCKECDSDICDDGFEIVRKRRIQKALKLSDKVYALNPDLLHILPGAEFLPYASVDPNIWKPTSKPPKSAPLRILHMPTNRAVKGTYYVEKACENLKGRGYSIDLLIVEGLPHNQIKEVMETAALVVDQLLVGWYGAAAVEAMALGRPVLCYLHQGDISRFVSFHDAIPVISTTKERLERDLARLLSDPTLRIEVGKRSRMFVKEFHNPLKIASRVIKAYQS